MIRARRGTAVLAWVLSVVLAVVFLVVGVPKLIGASTFGLHAPAMSDFPAWIRIVVGVVEVAGAIALLIPMSSGFAALSLACLMIPATITQWMSGEGGAWLPIVLFVLLLVLARLREQETFAGAWRGLAHTPHPVLREGIVAGVIGATCIAVWFLIIDSIARHPLFTPATLGRALFSVFGPEPKGESMLLHVGVYTIFHYVAFILVGICAAVVVRASRLEPSVLLGFVILFAATEVGFYGFVALLQHSTPLGALAWYQVMAGNLIAAIAMGVYLWRAHPALREGFAHALGP